MMAARLFSKVSAGLKSGVRGYSADAAEHAQHIKTANLWKYLTYFVVPPALIATYYNAFYLVPHHERPDYVEYEHLRIRTKPFPWGDGNHTLFHNPEMNAVPSVGYEADPPHHH